MAEDQVPGPRGAQVDLDGAVAVVTGASSGIGQAVAHALHERGARVVVSARNAERLEPVARELKGLAISCDVGEYAQVERLVQQAVDWGGKLTVMVNNAGVGAFGFLHEIDPEKAAAMVRTNVIGVINGMRVAGERLVRQGQGGGIVNVSSIVGEFPDPGGGAYAASKAAVDLLSRTAYRELREYGIHVVNIKPALTDTEFSAVARGLTNRRMGGDPPEKVARWVVDCLESGSANAGYR
ncbi:MAG: 3-oxoacyl-[acyl-carrier protein] reductase [Gaiellales bacterium]|nr:3-oxoacyl-[acyl-carrier protein] reductase [Gaiellales bacterium]MDX6592456.1 3-oxoacyl-[acyl-carrier protein] reductase [Gaiellales bacterium]